MKKLVILFITVLYLLPAIGFSINIHLCGGKIRAVSISDLHSEKCPCGKKMPSGCCKDFHKVLKLTDSQKSGSQLSISNKYSFKQLFESSFILQYSFIPALDAFDFVSYHAPPYNSRPPVYLTGGAFRI